VADFIDAAIDHRRRPCHGRQGLVQLVHSGVEVISKGLEFFRENIRHFEGQVSRRKLVQCLGYGSNDLFLFGSCSFAGDFNLLSFFLGRCSLRSRIALNGTTSQQSHSEPVE
jgi:hypothetical protein